MAEQHLQSIMLNALRAIGNTALVIKKGSITKSLCLQNLHLVPMTHGNSLAQVVPPP